MISGQDMKCQAECNEQNAKQCSDTQHGYENLKKHYHVDADGVQTEIVIFQIFDTLQLTATNKTANETTPKTQQLLHTAIEIQSNFHKT